MITDFGQQALLSIVSHLVFIGVAWWAIQALQIEKIIKKNHVVQARLLYIILSIVLGSAVSNFFLDYLLWSKQLPALLP
ncbi:MAG: DUF1146 family protein [Bacillus sp. (in: firmicutes)]|uniref:DUF1146 family protein n=1 Tax=Bacillus marasmi TaxID=1926279 RepID=UPI0011C7AC1B|nr:DUF1146 family protein [Bacillus marasmi]